LERVLADRLLLSPEHIRNFWLKVRKAGPDDCWIWAGWRNSFGHGRFEVAGDKLLASHVALILSGQPRPKPPNDFALHGDTCESAACVNPAHLRWGTAQQNADDRDRLGRRTPPIGEGHGNSKLSEEQVRYARSRTDISQRAMARELGVTQPLIGAIRRREIWTHLP
jgi:hypothetical protein